MHRGRVVLRVRDDPNRRCAGDELGDRCAQGARNGHYDRGVPTGHYDQDGRWNVVAGYPGRLLNRGAVRGRRRQHYRGVGGQSRMPACRERVRLPRYRGVAFHRLVVPHLVAHRWVDHQIAARQSGFRGVGYRDARRYLTNHSLFAPEFWWGLNAKRPPLCLLNTVVAISQFKSGGVLLSHKVPLAVPSAQRVLASGFGM